MTPPTDPKGGLQVLPLIPQRWQDLETLFGPRGACGGCWCMFWRLTRSEFEQLKGENNRQALHSLVNYGQVPGLIAYSSTAGPAFPGIPVGWISIGPRQDFSVLQRSRVLKPVDDQPVWSIVCFFVSKQFRRQGITKWLIQAAVQYAGSCGARIVEAYPVEPRQDKSPDVFVFTGLPGPFIESGFIEVARRSQTRPVMRFYIGG